MPFLLGQAEARDFNPRSPCGERRTPRLWRWITSIFQSTLPVWGATQLCRAAAAAQGDFNPRSPCGERPLFDEKIIQRGIEDFNPRSPCGERPPFGFLFPALVNFNPRSPCGERRSTSNVDTSPRTFQSTLPVWGATAEGRRGTIVATNFNPRSPCGERPERTGRGPSKSAISIHAPRVGSDLNRYCRLAAFAISIHAPRVGSDSPTAELEPEPLYFNPRSPCGERPSSLHILHSSLIFQSTLPVWGATRLRSGFRFFQHHFNPRSPCGERPVF